jgi:hypothetical protein
MKKLLNSIFAFLILLVACSKEEQAPAPPPTPTFTLNFSADTGGTVSTEGGTYNQGSKITVTATPDGQFLFKEWSDGSTQNPREITVTSNLTLKASFIKKTYPLSVTIDGEGTVQEQVIIQGSTTETEYNAGTTVRLTATPNEGWEFSMWVVDGAVITENPIEVAIEKGREATVFFKRSQYPLNEAPEEFSATPDIYSAILKWKYIDDPRIDSIVIFKGRDASDLIRYVSIANNSSEGSYVDQHIGVRQTYFYRIQYQTGDLFTNFSEIVQVQAIEPINNNTPINDEIGGIHYAYWDFPVQTFEEISHRFTIHEEPTDEMGNLSGDGLYYQFYQGILNDTIGFYYGIQTRLLKPGKGFDKGIIFSRWKSRDPSNWSLSEDSWGESAGYEGDFIGIRKHYSWEVGSYEMTIKRDSSDTTGDWYSLNIKRDRDSMIDYIGSIRFEKSSLSSGIKTGGITWTELYAKVPTGTPLPNWRVSVDKVIVDSSIEPNRVYVTYNNQRFVNFSNIYTTNMKDVQFIMGPKVKRVNTEGYLWR